MQCTRCGFASPALTSTCSQCGQPFTVGADPAMRALLPVGRTMLSIVAGYLGLAAILCFPAPFALGVGIWAVVDLQKKPGMHGLGRAWFGIVMGALGTLGLIGSIVASAMRHR